MCTYRLPQYTLQMEREPFWSEEAGCQTPGVHNMQNSTAQNRTHSHPHLAQMQSPDSPGGGLVDPSQTSKRSRSIRYSELVWLQGVKLPTRCRFPTSQRLVVGTGWMLLAWCGLLAPVYMCSVLLHFLEPYLQCCMVLHFWVTFLGLSIAAVN